MNKTNILLSQTTIVMSILSRRGEDIYTTSPNHFYEAVHGTSFSAPIVSGTVAMMKAISPTLRLSGKIDELLKTTAKDFGAPGQDPFYWRRRFRY